MPTPDDVFGPVPKFPAASSSDLSPSSLDLAQKSFVVGQNRDAHGYLHTDQLVLPVIDSLQLL